MPTLPAWRDKLRAAPQRHPGRPLMRRSTSPSDLCATCLDDTWAGELPPPEPRAAACLPQHRRSRTNLGEMKRQRRRGRRATICSRVRSDPGDSSPLSRVGQPRGALGSVRCRRLSCLSHSAATPTLLRATSRRHNGATPEETWSAWAKATPRLPWATTLRLGSTGGSAPEENDQPKGSEVADRASSVGRRGAR